MVYIYIEWNIFRHKKNEIMVSAATWMDLEITEIRLIIFFAAKDGNQIDYILCSQRWRSSLQSAKARLGADCGSDHELLIAKFRLKLKKPLDHSGMT